MASAPAQPRFTKGTVALAAAALSVLLILPGAARAAQDDNAAKAETLIRRADELGLAQSRGWQFLLHYRRGLTGLRSLVDDPGFFLSPTGKTDPRDELHATIRALFGAAADATDSVVCRFPARLQWLSEKLEPQTAGIPVPRCDEFEEIVRSIDPVSVTLTFPTAYLNSPASLFGHTLLHIRSSSDSALLSNAISYSASTTETNGLVFAAKGIFGMYPGYYNVTPYYQKLQQYNDIDQRDVWEYELNFTPAEIRRMMAHVYELRNIYADYYFFTENCAYDLLYLLDVARPGLDLTESVRPWVIPLDTVKAIADAGLIRAVDYRPSKATRLRTMAEGLDPEARDRAVAVALGGIPPDSVRDLAADTSEAVRTLDTAAEYLQMLRGKSRIPKSEFAPRFFKVLAARSKLGSPELSEYEFPVPPRPEGGHDSLRLSIGAGIEDHKGFQNIAFRPAYHEWLDPDDGYVEGSIIEFMGITLRRWNTPERIQLQRVDLLRIESLAPRDRFIKPISWKVHTGIEREPVRDERHTSAFLSTGGGGTWRLPTGGLAYTLLETDVRVGDYSPEWAAGFGARTGILQRVGKRWKTHAFIRALRYPLGDDHTRLEVTWGQRLTLTPAAALTVELSRRYQRQNWETQAALQLHLYF